MQEFTEGTFDVVVVGAGHAGCEAALACARTGLSTAMLTLNLDSIAFMACNPSIGGTAKGHLVREIDALGGEMGINADKTALQMRMLNVGKGAAVQSLRCQSDKNAYHAEMKRTLEHTPGLRIIQGEAEKIIAEGGKVRAVRTTYGGILYCKAAILCTGVYLNAETVTGDVVKKSGPNGFAPAAPKAGFDAIPMWVADMNFATVPTIPAALAARAAHPAYGYFTPREAYYQAIIRWQEVRNGVSGLKAEHIGYENGVLGGVISALNAICAKGDKVLLHSPTYVGFTRCMTNNGYHMVLSPLRKDDSGVWRMDFEDMEEKLRAQKIHAAVLCSPHNPTGRVWERWELERAMELFARYDVKVISDEIWSDLILAGNKHIPTQMVNEWARQNTVAVYAPSKTFNLAGLVGSYHIIYDKWLRDRVEKESSLSHYNEMNVLSMHALIAAYSPEGEAWVLTGNVDYACNYIKEHFKGVETFHPQGTYMLFLDCQDWCSAHGQTLDQLQRAGLEVGVIWQDGRPFHGPWAIRMNLALPRSRVEEAFHRLDRYVFHPRQA